MEAHYDSVEFTDKQFQDACESVDTESEEQSISESIQEILSEYNSIEEENYIFLTRTMRLSQLWQISLIHRASSWMAD